MTPGGAGQLILKWGMTFHPAADTIAGLSAATGSGLAGTGIASPAGQRASSEPPPENRRRPLLDPS